MIEVDQKFRDKMCTKKQFKKTVSIDEKLMKEWDFNKNKDLNPNEISIWSKNKYWWKCEKGHEWQAEASKRTSYNVHLGSGCPFCEHKRVTSETSLSCKYPELIKEWDYSKNNLFTPDDVSYGSAKIACWKCKNGHEWNSAIRSRTINEHGCPVCTNRRVIPETSLAGKYPELMKEWDYSKNNLVDPYTINYNSDTLYWWKCKKGHEWKAEPYHRTQCNAKCIYCGNKKVCLDNCIFTTHYYLVKEWNYEKNGKLTPYDFTYGSTKSVWWKCKNGHEWKSKISNRSNGIGCPDCNKLELLDGMVVNSYIEAYYYLLFKNSGINVIYNERYEGLGKCRFDFYVPEINTYIEVTSYDKNKCYGNRDKNGIYKRLSYIKYLRKIVKKKRLVKKNGANFVFIKRILNKEELKLVRENIKH